MGSEEALDSSSCSSPRKDGEQKELELRISSKVTRISSDSEAPVTSTCAAESHDGSAKGSSECGAYTLILSFSAASHGAGPLPIGLHSRKQIR